MAYNLLNMYNINGSAKIKVKCFEKPHYACIHRWRSLGYSNER